MTSIQTTGTNASASNQRTQIIELAKKAANEFSSGNFTGGLAIVGVALELAAVLTFLLPESHLFPDELNKFREQFAFLFGGIGCVFILLAGLLHIQKVMMKQYVLSLLAKVYMEVMAGLLANVKPGTVNSDELSNIADKYFESALKFFSDH